MGLTQDLVNWYSISNVEIYFGDDGTKRYLIFQPIFKYFTLSSGSDRILAWKSKTFPKENIKPCKTLDNSLAKKLTYIHNTK